MKHSASSGSHVTPLVHLRHSSFQAPQPHSAGAQNERHQKTQAETTAGEQPLLYKSKKRKFWTISYSPVTDSRDSFKRVYPESEEPVSDTRLLRSDREQHFNMPPPRQNGSGSQRRRMSTPTRGRTYNYNIYPPEVSQESVWGLCKTYFWEWGMYISWLLKWRSNGWLVDEFES